MRPRFAGECPILGPNDDTKGAILRDRHAARGSFTPMTIDTATGLEAPAELSSERVRDIFSHIARKYERFNALSSFGAYKLWLAGMAAASVFTGEYHYYYEKLSDDDKLIYRQIYAMMQKRMDGISLNTTDTDNVSRIQQFVLLDNPQFFYIEKSQYTVRNSIIFSPVYNKLLSCCLQNHKKRRI